MTELQNKIYTYFLQHPELQVLFMFDSSLTNDYQAELESAEWDDGYQLVIFQGDWFATKYRITHEWQDLKTILLFNGTREPTTREAMVAFPLLGALKANMAYKELPYDAFIQQYHIPVSMAMFVQKHLTELQRSSVIRWAKQYYSPSFDTNTGMCLLLSSFLDQERLLSLDHIMIRILLLAVDSQAKRDAFFRKLQSAGNRDVLEYINKEFMSLVGQELNSNSVQHVEKIVESLKYIEDEYYSLNNDDDRKEFFLSVREKYNTKELDDVDNSTNFIFLNRTCFNGLYRVNKSGMFNVPFGRDANPTICDPDTIIKDSELLQGVEILNGDFESTIEYASGNTLFYFDPPYRPLSDTSAFKEYSKDGFNDLEQVRLKNYCDTINTAGFSFMLSNSDCKGENGNDGFFDVLYSNYDIVRVLASRSINSNPAKRGKLTEILVRNFV